MKSCVFCIGLESTNTLRHRVRPLVADIGKQNEGQVHVRSFYSTENKRMFNIRFRFKITNRNRMYAREIKCPKNDLILYLLTFHCPPRVMLRNSQKYHSNILETSLSASVVVCSPMNC
jgi:hypothetical protein